MESAGRAWSGKVYRRSGCRWYGNGERKEMLRGEEERDGTASKVRGRRRFNWTAGLCLAFSRAKMG